MSAHKVSILDALSEYTTLEATRTFRVLIGASVFVSASDTVGFFGETYLNMRPVQADGAFEGGLFRFNVVSFGMKFFPSMKSRPGEMPIEANVGATVPYMQRYWQYHYGSVMGQVNYYPET